MEKALSKNALIIISLCMLFWLSIPQDVFAQETCHNLTGDSEWNEGMKSVAQLIQAGNYTQARTEAKTLSRICDQSPALHYMQGKIAEGLNQRSDALLHYQKASEYTYKFAVEPDMARKIWYARYENEHPERTAQSLEESARQNELRLNENTSELMSQFHEDQKQRNYKLMWTGIGLSLGGAAFLGTGIGLWVKYYNDPLNKKRDHVQLGYKLSTALMGCGSALTLSGIIMAGLFGYWYKKEQPYSLYISPMGASFQVLF